MAVDLLGRVTWQPHSQSPSTWLPYNFCSFDISICRISISEIKSEGSDPFFCRFNLISVHRREARRWRTPFSPIFLTLGPRVADCARHLWTERRTWWCERERSKNVFVTKSWNLHEVNVFKCYVNVNFEKLFWKKLFCYLRRNAISWCWREARGCREIVQ